MYNGQLVCWSNVVVGLFVQKRVVGLVLVCLGDGAVGLMGAVGSLNVLVS